MERRTYMLRFADVSAAEGNQLAADLRETLLDASERVSVERTRDDSASQDLGATLVLILGTPAIVAVVEAIKAFLTRTNASGLEVRTPQGELLASNLESKDIADIIRALTSHS